MKRRLLAVILAGPLLFGLPILQSLFGQTCSDDEGMVKSYVQSIDGLVSKVKKENLTDFQNDYHKQSCLSRLTMSLGIIDSLINCLNKAAKDPTATKDQVAAINSKLQSYTKLKATLQKDHDTLKAAKTLKSAKSIIEKFVIST